MRKQKVIHSENRGSINCSQNYRDIVHSLGVGYVAECTYVNAVYCRVQCSRQTQLGQVLHNLQLAFQHFGTSTLV